MIVVEFGRSSFFHHPPRLHALEFIVHHKRAKSVGHVVVRQEPNEILVKLERQGELRVNLQIRKMYM